MWCVSAAATAFPAACLLPAFVRQPQTLPAKRHLNFNAKQDTVAERLLDRLEDCRRSFERAVVLGGAGAQVAARLAGGRAGIQVRVGGRGEQRHGACLCLKGQAVWQLACRRAAGLHSGPISVPISVCMPPQPPKSLLDIACAGLGLQEVIHVDTSQAMLERARSHAQASTSGGGKLPAPATYVHWQPGSEVLPLEPASVDCECVRGGKVGSSRGRTGCSQAAPGGFSRRGVPLQNPAGGPDGCASCHAVGLVCWQAPKEGGRSAVGSLHIR